MPAVEDVLTKGLLIKWLAGVPNDANIALEINEFGQLDFIVIAANGQERTLRVGVIGAGEGEQTDRETVSVPNLGPLLSRDFRFLG